MSKTNNIIKIENSTLSDISLIFELYKTATDFMKSKDQVFWPKFSKDLIINEINENKQWKLLINEQIACVWASNLNDEMIWGAKNNTPSVYIHRIASDSNFRGKNLVNNIIEWGNKYGKTRNLKYIRLDTVGINKGLIKHYEKLGFKFLGSKILKDTKSLPEHYKKGEICYFQKEIV